MSDDESPLPGLIKRTDSDNNELDTYLLHNRPSAHKTRPINKKARISVIFMIEEEMGTRKQYLSLLDVVTSMEYYREGALVAVG